MQMFKISQKKISSQALFIKKIYLAIYFAILLYLKLIT